MVLTRSSARTRRCHAVTLNDDVLWNVCTFLDPLDALQPGKTCRRAYRITIPSRLRSVDLYGLPGTVSFGSFVLGEHEHLCKLIRSLTLSSGTVETFQVDLLDLLFAVLLEASCQGLHLHLPGMAVGRSSLLCRALGMLKDLTVLSIRTDLEYFDRVLLHLRGRLRVLALGTVALNDLQEMSSNRELNELHTLELDITSSCLTNGQRWQEIASVRTLIVSVLAPICLRFLSHLYPLVTELRFQPRVRKVEYNIPVKDMLWDFLDIIRYAIPPPIDILARVVHITKDPASPVRLTQNVTYLDCVNASEPVVLVCFMQLKFIRRMRRLALELRYLSLYQASEQLHLDKHRDFKLGCRLVDYAFALHDVHKDLVGVCFHFNAHSLKRRRATPFEEDALRGPVMKLAVCVPTLQYICIRAGGILEDETSAPDVEVWFHVDRSDRVLGLERLTRENGSVAEEMLLASDGWPGTLETPLTEQD